MFETSIDLPALDFRAAVASADEQKRTVDLIFSTGAAVERYDYASGSRYSEVLSMDEKHVDLRRLNSGAPLLNSHSSYSVGDILGSVELGSARIEAGKGVATVRFSRRDDVEPIFRDVLDGIIRSVSVGYRVSKYEQTDAKSGALPVRLATQWTPYEVSLVAMPADTGAKVRDANKCLLISDAPLELARAQSGPRELERRGDALLDGLRCLWLEHADAGLRFPRRFRMFFR